MTSKYKKKNKTLKILKGGASALVKGLNGIDKSSDLVKGLTDIDKSSALVKAATDGFPNEILKDFLTFYINPFGGIIQMVKMVYNELKFSIDMVNNIFLETGLYITNLYEYGFESSLQEILKDGVCFDLFDEITCKTSIGELLYMSKLSDKDPIIHKILNKNKSGKIIQNGGSTVEPITPNAIVIKSHNISTETFFSDDKDYVKKYILNQFLNSKLPTLYDILKSMKIMHHLYDKHITNVKIIKNPPVPIVNNKINIGYNSFVTFNLCSNYHQGKNVTDEISKYFEKDADVNKICEINDITMYEQSKQSSSNINYTPVFTIYFEDIAKVLKNYYTVNNINSGELKHETNLDPFKYFDSPKTTNEQMKNDVSEELKDVYKLIKLFSIHEVLFQLFLYKFEKLSENDKDKFIESINK